jgi:hypothetical protein
MTAMNELDKVEILTLQDNYIDMTATDNSEIIYRRCTGRKSIQRIEAAMPENFLLNMAGTRLTFAA